MGRETPPVENHWLKLQLATECRCPRPPGPQAPMMGRLMKSPAANVSLRVFLPHPYLPGGGEVGFIFPIRSQQRLWDVKIILFFLQTSAEEGVLTTLSACLHCKNKSKLQFQRLSFNNYGHLQSLNIHLVVCL